MSQFDPHGFLHRTYYALDFQVLSGDLIDFLETAERGLDFQYHENRDRIETSVSDDDLPGYREHLLENLAARGRSVVFTGAPTANWAALCQAARDSNSPLSAIHAA